MLRDKIKEIINLHCNEAHHFDDCSKNDVVDQLESLFNSNLKEQRKKWEKEHWIKNATFEKIKTESIEQYKTTLLKEISKIKHKWVGISEAEEALEEVREKLATNTLEVKEKGKS